MDKNMNMPDMPHTHTPTTLGNITEFSLNWPGKLTGSTHELVMNKEFIFVTGQNMHKVAKFNYKGELLTYYEMPEGSGPHGLLINAKGQLWVSLEFHGLVARLDDDGHIAEEIDVKIHAKGAEKPINTAPHGIGLDADGETIWFTGKRTSTLGKINPDRSVEHFELPNLSSLPIFLSAGPGGIWGTELFGSAILHKPQNEEKVKEFKIPTANSRPIAVIPDPDGSCMWFTEEAGVRVGKIDANGHITEYTIPALQKNDILASLSFDYENNLWVQVYVDSNNPTPAGYDYIIKIDKSIRELPGNDLSGVPFVTHTIPSKMSMMHRIRMGFDGNLWFTEMMTDKLGKITLK